MTEEMNTEVENSSPDEQKQKFNSDDFPIQSIVTHTLIAIAAALVGYLLGFSGSYEEEKVSFEENISYKVIQQMEITEPVLIAIGGDDLVFSSISVYEFVKPPKDASLEDTCIPMRIWNNHQAYFSCGDPGEKVLMLEGEYFNRSARVQPY